MVRKLLYYVCRALGAGLIAGLVAGCVTNPVTGRQEIGWVTDAQAVAVGEQSYLPAQQTQGGVYRVDPAVTDYVRRVGAAMAAASEVDLPYEFVVLNNSVPNAWALPGGKLAVNRGLLTELDSEAELAAVLGHEVVHAAARHGAKSMERGTVLQSGLLLGAVFAQGSEYGGALMSGAQAAAGLINQRYGRDAEREADYYGTRYMASAGYDPQAAVSLQETFVRLSGGRDSSWLDGLFASHPPSTERVENNRQLVAELRAEGFTDGRIGTDAHQAAIASLVRDKAAYEAYDAGRKAFSEGDYDMALEQASKAIAAEPREGLFHALRGDVRRAQGRHQDAVVNYGRAIKADDQLFSHYLGRGLSHMALNESEAAKTDFNASVALLPTSVAYNQLGRIAEAEGRTDAALRYYEAASESTDVSGQAARASFYRLEVPRQPSQYVVARVVGDPNGAAVLLVRNETPLPMADVRLQVELTLANGRTLRGEETVAAIGGGQTVSVPLGRAAADVLEGRGYAVSARVVAEP